MRRASVLIDLILLETISIILVSYSFRGVTSICDGAMHLSKVKILLDNFKVHGYFLQWNPYWYFGVPMWRTYPPLSYYMVVSLSWMLNHSMLEEIVMMWSFLVFSLVSTSTYLLAKEMGLKRLGSLISSILFLFSFNLLAYWGIGSYPNVTSVAFSPLALLFFYRAAKKRNLANTFAAGLTFAAVILTHVMNAIILSIFVVVLSVLMIVREHSLLYVSRGPLTPPKYTLILPKILFGIILIAAALSLWWVLPFSVTYLSARAIPEAARGGALGATWSLQDQIVALLGVYPNMDSPGFGHFILAAITCVLVFTKRDIRLLDAPLCFIVAVIFSLAPWFRIPVGSLFWWRFTLYLSIFASICGGIFIDFIKDYYSRFPGLLSIKKSNEKSSHRIYSSSIIALILLVSIYPSVASGGIVFPSFDVSEKPEYIQFLEDYAGTGERVAVDGGYDFNIYTETPQSGGGNIYDVYMTNEFAYVFWRYMFVKQDSRYLTYFARSYNVKWFVGSGMSGLARTDFDQVYEVTSFNTSLVEIVGPESRIVLFVGDEDEYSRFFTSIALSNPKDIITVYGGKSLDEHDVATLIDFNAVYVSSLTSKDASRLSLLLSDYTEAGGCLILDTGNIESEGQIKDLPAVSPTGEVTYEESLLRLYSSISHDVIEGVNLTSFSAERFLTISRSGAMKEGAVPLIYDEGKPVLIYWGQGLGKVYWTGLRLPYLIMLDEDDEAKSREEAKLLLNLLRQAKSRTNASRSPVHFEQTRPEETIVHISNGSVGDAIWVKMGYYPGWTTQIVDEAGRELRIHRAGPNMMLVFPGRGGDYTVRFHFDETLDVRVSEYVSLLSMILLTIITIYRSVAGLRKRASKISSPVLANAEK